LHRLSEPESAKILEQLDLREPKMMEAVRAEWAKKHFKLPENARATVAVFVPATGGEKVLRELGVTGGVQKALLKLAEPENLAKLRAHEKFFHRSMELEIEVGWNNATDAEKQLLMEDLKALYPESIPVTVDHYKNWILNNLARIAGDQPERILWLSLERIPPMLRRQLADYWAFSTLWGITDPRPANWLMREGQVLALDFAFKTRTFKEGAAVIGVVGETKFPFGPGPLREGMRDFLLANISSDMRKWLSSLDSRQIEAMMKASGHPIVRAEVSGVVKRAKLLSAGRQPGLRR
ncbi:MAG: hypothetical protein ACXVBW_09370, partial [Bdellovibrionota bacterium]